jgi:excisionase family DNA binding protein
MCLKSIESQNPEVEPLLDIVSVAKFLGCSPRHVSRLASSGKMPAPVEVGSLIRWSKQSIKEWVSAGCPDCSGGVNDD